MNYSDPNCFTYPFQLTKTLHRSMYAYLDPTRENLSAKGKSVLITGVAGGLGPAIAKAWCIAGAKAVIITSRNQEVLDQVAKELRAASPATTVLVHVADLTSEHSVQELFSTIQSQVGFVDVLINSAASLNTGKIETTAADKWWLDLETNLKGLFLLTHGFLKLNAERQDCTLINIGSGAAGLTVPEMSGYSISKLAQQKLVEFVQAEQPNVRAFTLIPGLPHTKQTLPNFVPYAKDELSLSGGLSLFLATAEADWLKGQTVSVNWDLEEMSHNKQAILSGQLTSLGWLKAQLQKEGHPF